MEARSSQDLALLSARKRGSALQILFSPKQAPEAERRPSVPHSAPLAFQTVTARRQVLVVV
jgi:hypothetical protein